MEQAKVLPFTTPNNNNYNNNAHARVEDQILIALDQAFQDVFDFPMRKYHRRMCLAWIAEGMSSEVIILAITQTAGAPFPAWRYTEAIIVNCFAWGILTPEKWLENLERHLERRNAHANHHNPR